MPAKQTLAIAVAALLARPALVGGGNPQPPLASIRGRVEVLEALAQVARRPAIADLGMPAPREVSDRRRSVVYLEAAPLGAFEQRPTRPAVMDQRHETFVPHVLAVSAGSSVDFRNSDETYHSVFSLSRTRPFDLGRYAAGRSKSIRFDKPGIVRVFCDIHSHMSAFILVFGHPYFALTDEEGRYRIDGVPTGTYSVRVWNEALSADSRRVTIADDGGEVEVNFSLGGKPPQRAGER